MKFKQLICELSQLEGISGFEYSFSHRIAEMLGEFCQEVYTDPLGSVHGILVCGKPDAKKVLLDAHMDEIGLMVSKISDEGFLHVVNIGGVDSRILPGTCVTVHGKERLPGTVAIRPPHIQTAAEMKQAMELSDLVVDIGYGPKKTKELVSVGDMITFDVKPAQLLGGRIAGKTLDDRAGVATLISAGKKLAKHQLSVDVELLISAQEETGLRGAETGGYRSRADMAIAVDVSHGKTPDASGDNVYTFGGGAMIGMGPNMDKHITRDLIRLAKEKELPHQVEVMGGGTGTNAWALQVLRSGIPCGLLSIPLRYMHTPCECIDLKDAKAVRDLMVAFVKLQSGRAEV